jgi:hypothetical protein
VIDPNCPFLRSAKPTNQPPDKRWRLVRTCSAEIHLPLFRLRSVAIAANVCRCKRTLRLRTRSAREHFCACNADQRFFRTDAYRVLVPRAEVHGHRLLWRRWCIPCRRGAHAFVRVELFVRGDFFFVAVPGSGLQCARAHRHKLAP